MTSQPRCDEYPSWNRKPQVKVGMFLYVKNLGWLESYFLIISASALFISNSVNSQYGSFFLSGVITQNIFCHQIKNNTHTHTLGFSTP